MLATTAFGITETLSGFKLARNVVFSLLRGVSWVLIVRHCSFYTPGMRNADDMINVAQRKLEQLVCHDTSSITEAEKRVIGENSSQTHRTCMQDSLMA